MTILLVEDHKPTRDEIRMLLEYQTDMRVIAETGSGEDALLLAQERQPDVVIMDILLPGMNGLEAIRRLHTGQPQTRILALSNHFGASLVQAVLDAGGLGYVRKSRAFEELIPALRTVADGKRHVDRRLLDGTP
jgi:two-component system invasion response regulator UvrY